MIHLSNEARQELEGFFADKEKSPVRIYLGGGCGGPRLTLALDEPGEEDSVVVEGGFTFCVDKELLEHIEGVKLFMTEEGFAVEAVRPLPFMGGASGSGGGCCGGGHGGHGHGDGHGHGGHGHGGGCCGGQEEGQQGNGHGGHGHGGHGGHGHGGGCCGGGGQGKGGGCCS